MEKFSPNLFTDNKNLDRYYKYISIILLSTYAAIMLYFYVNIQALIPDEEWFLGIIKELSQLSLKELLFVDNRLGYGSFYWITYALLGNIDALRRFAWLCLMVTPMCVVYIIYNKAGWKEVLFSLIIYIYCPMSWFTGKIIGPELFGNAIGAIGTTIGLSEKGSEKRARIIAGILIGISTGVKLYNLVFGVFLYSCILATTEKWNLQEFVKLIKTGCHIAGGAGIGFLGTNMIVLYNAGLYFQNIITYKQGVKLSYIWRILTAHIITWDLVNAGGFGTSIMPLLGLGALLIIGLMDKKSRRFSIATLISFLVIVLVFSTNGGILGWYYIPFLYFLPLCVNNKKLIYIVFLVNFVFISSDVEYQIFMKQTQIVHVREENQIEQIIKDNSVGYDEYEKIYLIDNGMTNLPMNSVYSIDTGKTTKKLIVISNIARSNDEINNLYNQAHNSENGLSILKSINDLTLIIKE